MCYLGFRPSEFLDLRVEHYNRAEKYFTGGSKTEAGKGQNRPVSPKIQKRIDALVVDKIGGYVFCDASGGRFNLRRFREDILLRRWNPSASAKRSEMHGF